MANQDKLIIGGIGGDPSGSYSQYDAQWRETDILGTRKYASVLGKTLIVPDVSGAGGTVYSEELAIKGSLLKGSRFTTIASGDPKIKSCWQWYDPTLAAGKVEGTWYDLGTLLQAAQEEILEGKDSSDNKALIDATKFRVKVTWITSLAGNEDDLNAADAFMAYFNLDSSAAKNLSGSVVNNPDPS